MLFHCKFTIPADRMLCHCANMDEPTHVTQETSLHRYLRHHDFNPHQDVYWSCISHLPLCDPFLAPVLHGFWSNG